MATSPGTTEDDRSDDDAARVGGEGDDSGNTDIAVLLFTRTEGFRHDSIEAAVAWFETLGPDGVEVTATEDPDLFSEDGLADFDVVAFVNTTGDVLDDPHQEAFEAWLEGGGGFVGVHSATDTEYDWEWYGDMIGAWFTSHPFVFQTVTVTNEAPGDPTTASFEPTFDYTDEWYNFDRNPRHNSDILLTIDETSGTYVHNGEPVTEFTQGDDHPVAWSRQVGLGRVFYTALGHMDETWQDDAFLDHLLAGVRWAADDARYRRSVITEEVEAPVALDVADSGLVLWAERGGAIKVWDPITSLIHEAGRVPTRVEGEGGLMGLRLAPDADRTGHLYVYTTLPGEQVGTNALLRVTLGADCTFTVGDDLEPLLEVPNQFAGHQGGDIEFLPDGTIVVSTGDNTDNVADGFAPIGGTGVPDTVDARRTSGNPDDLRGKILRINPDGSIPDGNLYPPDGSRGRPEVYITGVRNPYRVAVHPDTGRLWFGDIGPDAIGAGERGPQGFDELNTASEPGDHGWPYCIGDNRPYRRFDLGSGEAGEPYDCSDRVPPVLAYDYVEVIDPALGAGFRQDRYDGDTIVLGRSMMAGPWYRPADGALAALPFADTLLLHEFSRNLLLSAEVDEDGSVTSLRRVAPWAGINTPIDVEVGPDGALYIVEYGVWNGMTSGAPAITRLEFSPSGDFAPMAQARLAPGTLTETTTANDGASIYRFNCSSCHGNRGQGGIGPSLQGVDDRLDRSDITRVVTEGRQRMPAWGERLSEAQIEAVVAHLDTLPEE